MSTYHFKLHRRRKDNGVPLNPIAWSICITDAAGKRVRRIKLPQITRKEAEIRMQQTIAEYGANPALYHCCPTSPVHEWLDRYLDLKQGEVRKATLDSHRRTVDLLREFFGNSLLCNATHRDMSDWRKWMKQEAPWGHGLAEGTVCKHCATAKVIFKRAVAEQMIPNDITDHLCSSPPKTDPHSRRIVTEQEISDACNARMFSLEYEREITPILMLCYYAGLRLSEAIHLKWGDIAPDWSRLTVKPREGEITTKQRTRTVRIEPKLREWLYKREMNRMPQLGETVAGLVEEGRQGMVHKLLKKTGATFMFKDLRSSRANLWMSAGFPTPVICAWMGHTQAVAQDHYLGVPEIFYEDADS